MYRGCGSTRGRREKLRADPPAAPLGEDEQVVQAHDALPAAHVRPIILRPGVSGQRIALQGDRKEVVAPPAQLLQAPLNRSRGVGPAHLLQQRPERRIIAGSDRADREGAAQRDASAMSASATSSGRSSGR